MNSIPAELTAEEIYEALASIVASDINDEWETATIHAVVNDDEDVTFQGIYTTAHRNVPEERNGSQRTVVNHDQDSTRLDNPGLDGTRLDNPGLDGTRLDNPGLDGTIQDVDDDSQKSESSDESECEETVNYFCTQSAVYDLILDLRRILHQAGTEPFNEIDFTLSRDGDYDLFFSYSDDIEIADNNKNQ